MPARFFIGRGLLRATVPAEQASSRLRGLGAAWLRIVRFVARLLVVTREQALTRLWRRGATVIHPARSSLPGKSSEKPLACAPIRPSWGILPGSAPMRD